MPWFVEERVNQWCVVKGTREDPIETVACHETEEAAQAQMRALFASENKDASQVIDESEKTAVESLEESETEDQELPVEKTTTDPDRFSVYKQADGSYRWASVSSVAIKDKEFEIVTEKAQDDAIQHANDTGEFGEIDLVHVDGTDVGKCDLMVRVGNRLIEGGTFDDTEIARGAIKALEADPDYWGISIKFVFDPSKFDGEKYNGNIRIRKRTILPQEMAASYGTKLVAIGGENPMEKQELSDRAREALSRLNVPEEDIEKLAEKQVDAEPNTVEKEAETETPEPEAVASDEPETVEVEKSLWDRIKATFSKPEITEPDAEPGGEEIVEAPAVEAQEEKEVVDVTAMADAMVEAVVGAIAKNLEAKDAQIATLGEAVLMLSQQVKDLQTPIEDKIEKRLAELPRVVKAAPSQTATIDKPTGRTFPLQGNIAAGESFVGEIMKDVQAAVQGVVSKHTKVQV